MRRPAFRVERENGHGNIHIIKCGASMRVPKAVWMWMEEQMREGDNINRTQAQAILRPDDERMRYDVAILRDGERQDVMGRSRRVTRVINYNETRARTPSSVEMEEIGNDRGQVHNTSQWGWRLYDVIYSDVFHCGTGSAIKYSGQWRRKWGGQLM